MDLAQVAQLLGLSYESEIVLSPSELLTRLVQINETLTKIGPRLTNEFLRVKLPGRERTVLGLINHISEISSVLIEVLRGEVFTASKADAEPQIELVIAELIPILLARNEVLKSVHIDPDRMADTYFGDQSLHTVINRTVWHSAQHLRQLVDLCQTQQAQLEIPEISHLLQDLPLPQKVWD